MRGKRIFIFISAILIFFIILSSATIINLYTKWLFFNEIKHPDVFVKMLSTKILVGLSFGVFSLAFILINVIVANKINFPYIDLFYIEQTKISLRTEGLNRVIKPLTVVAGIIAGLFVGFWGSLMWREVLIFQNSMSIGMNDPIFGRDISFYMFELPLLEFIKSFLGLTLMATLLIISINYFLRGGIAVKGNNISIDGRVKRHTGILTGFFIVNISFGFYLDKFKLLLSEHGVIFGAGYTDIYARLPALNILIILTFITGIIFITGLFMKSWKIALFPVGFIAIAYVVGLIVYPSMLQSFKVSPNELVLEKPFIEHNIKFTRFGYDLERIEVRPFNVSYNLTVRDIKKNHATIKNIRLWDDTPLLKTYSQLQQIRTYYKFTGIDNDRYLVNSEYMQVMMSPRELSYDDLPSKSWINEKMIFTHGNGITMGPVSRISREGLPEFIIKDIPPVSSSDIKITKPEIYFGELSSDYVIVKTKIPEFSYPTSEGNIYTSYKGTGGIDLSSFVRRAVFAVRFNTAKIVLSSDITQESRILYNRNIIERVSLIAPFLIYDKDPYIVVSEDGRLFWIIDAYTVSNRVLYSKPLNRNINYIRNSVKVAVDAYNGSVDFYISDPDDVMVRVYSAIFPHLFKPFSKMPDDLRRHIRYPQGLLRVQASMFATYHMTDPKVFYNKEDLWEIPVYGNKSMEPYYTIMRLPEDKKEEYILLLPYTPAKRDNLAAWLAARCDEPNYGKLIVYTFPRDRLVFGPRQIDARIDQDAYISQQLTLWGQRGSQVIRGSLLVIPIESSLLYIQPLYLAAEDRGGLPELRRVIVAYENDVVMEENLELGLQRLFGGRKILPAKEKLEDVRASIDELAKDAMQAYERAIELLRQGDWAGYGEQLKRLERILKRIVKK
ncbi:MAG: UPF0182 family protein [Nitrospirota bacterium]